MKINELYIRILSQSINSFCSLLFTLLIANRVDLKTFSILSYCLASPYSISNVLVSRYIISKYRDNYDSNLTTYLQIIRQRCVIYLIPFFIFQFCVLTYFELQKIEALMWCVFSISIALFNLNLYALSFSQNAKVSLAINSFNLFSISIFIILQQNVIHITYEFVEIIIWLVLLVLSNSFLYLKSDFSNKLAAPRSTASSFLTVESLVNQSFYFIFILGLMSISQESYGLTRISHLFITSLPLLFITTYSQNIIKKYSSISIKILLITLDTGKVLCIIIFNIFLLIVCKNIIDYYFKYSLQDIYKYAFGSIFFIISLLYQQISFYFVERDANMKNFVVKRIFIYSVSYIVPLSIVYNYGFSYYNFGSFVGLLINMFLMLYFWKKMTNKQNFS